jgi:hypothetical protein
MTTIDLNARTIAVVDSEVNFVGSIVEVTVLRDLVRMLERNDSN